MAPRPKPHKTVLFLCKVTKHFNRETINASQSPIPISLWFIHVVVIRYTKKTAKNQYDKIDHTKSRSCGLLYRMAGGATTPAHAKLQRKSHSEDTWQRRTSALPGVLGVGKAAPQKTPLHFRRSHCLCEKGPCGQCVSKNFLGSVCENMAFPRSFPGDVTFFLEN